MYPLGDRKGRVSAGAFTGAAIQRPTGNSTMKRVPSLRVLSTVTAPPCALAIHATKLSPSPRPFSGSAEGTR